MFFSTPTSPQEVHKCTGTLSNRRIVFQTKVVAKQAALRSKQRLLVGRLGMVGGGSGWLGMVGDGWGWLGMVRGINNLPDTGIHLLAGLLRALFRHR